ncbi:TPA: chemotaxis protein CheA [Clostridioides difficile]|uniref:chemotaxis protein CheA n=1 Tax=Clostridioides difficile TaxID=1496 RepID=UPI00038CDEC7|nr:chemotaxis protein CheA [Clostridioides difficile]EQF56734.1 histidine kinase-, DNA gyrase B-, and HSP90-like ATPase family protein [Clostridioides difficile CD181]EQG39535.1 histidine kinase-, DNA gyrase B-, and HSP90-like ATPase family protein [Clostridioides difficile DA00128]EQH67540.1 histidine kinase-, DNA gyrase B-, and HSP90-like ATPase family protein [Clostridioides difficile DA00273]EQK83395.1 histidine kinase-, DNA gyrase B-, and HSP90-like ATPase family protein [Clostridioides di
MRQMLDMFIFETSLLLEQLDEIMIQIEKEKVFTHNNINETFRIMHTIKGSASMMGLDNISALAHSVEDLFYAIREGKIEVLDNDLLFDLVFQSLDFIRRDIDELQSRGCISSDYSNFIEGIEEYVSTLELSSSMKSKDNANLESKDEKEVIDSNFEYKEDSDVVKIIFEQGCMMENVRAFMLVFELRDYCEFIDFYPKDVETNAESTEYIKSYGFYIQFVAKEDKAIVYKTIEDNLYVKEYINISKKEIEMKNTSNNDAVENKLKDNNKVSKSYQNNYTEDEIQEDVLNEKTDMEKDSLSEDNEHLPISKQSIMSVNLEKLDLLQNIVGEIVIMESMVVNSVNSTGVDIDNFNKATRQLHKLTDELQDIVMSMRMIQIAGVFQKMHRIVRDMNKKLDKNVELITIGAETEVDKSVIDNLAEPFMHLIRNAMDHAIEPIEERIAKGKEEVGKIVLSAENLGGEAVISISDDGRGIMRDKILAKAKEQGLLKHQSNEYTDDEVNSLIMTPGFSTKESITEFSGRGVGMDIVRKSIEKVGGSIEVKSKQDEGTTFTIKIPLTLSIVEGMKFKVGDSLFTLPISSIRRTFKLTDLNQIITEGNKTELITIYGACIPIIRLHKIYNIQTKVTNLMNGNMIIIENEHKAVCIFVDEIIGNQQVVVKPFPVYFNRFNIKNKGLSGCTILGDGSISLIIDADSIIEIY